MERPMEPSVNPPANPPTNPPTEPNRPAAASPQTTRPADPDTLTGSRRPTGPAGAHTPTTGQMRQLLARLRSREARHLPRHHSPLRTPLSAAPWRATAYLLAHLLLSGPLFAISLTALVAAAVFAQLTVTLALTVGCAWLVRCCAQVERGRAVLIDAPIPYAYQPVAEPGLAGAVKARFTDPAFYRDCAHLVLLFPFLLLFDAVVLGVWLLLLAGALLPAWFWLAPSTRVDDTLVHGRLLGRSDGQGPGVSIDSWPTAISASLCCVVLALAFSHLVVGAARLQLALAHRLLGPPSDPLASAKRVLAEPGPLTLAVPPLHQGTDS
ncbi:sensor domain-containing protein [Streptomyces sp. NPDC057638]|uniref:sensor domain-containing protein n=1 Tax=Streptomyces sp. NPDC057638 TaxID=3346190 RepID=UPI0036CD64F3